MAKAMKTEVSIIVPTFRRPEGLEIALRSLITQTANGLPMEIIIADNDPAGSAKPFVTEFSKTSPIKVHYLHVPSPGVSNARNAALEKAKGRYLAFLDDDQEAGKNWLETLLDMSIRFEAALCFVPTIARIPGTPKYESVLIDYFSRPGPNLHEGVIDEFFGCGNSLIDTHLCTLPTPAFDPSLNETGGEDDRLFGFIQNQGVKIAWSKAATAYEDIRPHRATPQYIKVRSFANGQGPSQHAYDDKNWAGILKWMIIGCAQYLINKPLHWITALMGHSSAIRFMGKAAEGAGKVLWFDRFTPKLYGAAVVENKAF